jgi:transposase
MIRQAYPSDLTDAQWEFVKAIVPSPKTGGRPAKYSRREVLNALLYLERTGCQWRALPHDLPPWKLVYWYFMEWRASGLLDLIHDRVRHVVTCPRLASPASMEAAFAPRVSTIARLRPALASHTYMRGSDFMNESNDFRRQRLSDFLAARLKSKQGNSDGGPTSNVDPGSTTPPGSAETSPLGPNDNDTSTTETSLRTRTHYPTNGIGSSN